MFPKTGPRTVWICLLGLFYVFFLQKSVFSFFGLFLAFWAVFKPVLLFLTVFGVFLLFLCFEGLNIGFYGCLGEFDVN